MIKRCVWLKDLVLQTVVEFYNWLKPSDAHIRLLRHGAGLMMDTKMSRHTSTSVQHGGSTLWIKYGFCEIIVVTSEYLFASEIWCVIHTCKAFACTNQLVSQCVIQCEFAAKDAISKCHTIAHKDRAAEYIASSELRHDDEYGIMSFSHFCYIAYWVCRKLAHKPMLAEILCQWDQLGVLDGNQLVSQAEWQTSAQVNSAIVPHFGIIVPKIVAARYGCDRAVCCMHTSICFVSKAAQYLGSSEIWALVCVCKTFASLEDLVTKRLVPCSSATVSVVSRANNIIKDDIVAQVVRAEMRSFKRLTCHDLSLDDLCRWHDYMRNMDYVKGVPRFCGTVMDTLGEWISADVSTSKSADGEPMDEDQRYIFHRAKHHQTGFQELAFLRVTTTQIPPMGIVIPAIVANRYLHAGVNALDDTVTIMYDLSKRFRHAGMMSEAVQLLEKIILLEPSRSEASYDLGMLYFEDGVIPLDVAYRALGVAVEHNHFMAALFLGYLHYENDDLVQAQLVLEHARQLVQCKRVERAELERLLGHVYLELDELDRRP